MLDKVINAAWQRVKTTAEEVRKKRAELWRERAGDTYRLAARTAQTHPEGFTTPPPKAYAAAQQEYAALRREWAALGPALLSLVSALMVARERRDEMKAEFDRWGAAEALRVAEGVHPEIKQFFREMFDHGVRPEQLMEVRPETLAIICDIARWDGHDPDMRDDTSPMPAIFRLFAERLIKMPGPGVKVERSQPGVPVPPVRYTDDRYYMFSELLEPMPDEPISFALPAHIDEVDAGILRKAALYEVERNPALLGQHEDDESRERALVQLIYEIATEERYYGLRKVWALDW